VKRLLFWSLIVLNGAFCKAQEATAVAETDTTIMEYAEDQKGKDFVGLNDTIAVAKTYFDDKTLHRLKNDPDYQYKQPPTLAESLWDRFWRWVGAIIRALLQGATTTGLGKILMYAIGIILLSSIIMMLLKVDAFRVFYSGADRGKISNVLFHENIHEMDFEKLLREAAQKEDFRQGTRLILLYALKLLADKNLIKWEAGKTNHDYVSELSKEPLKTGLNELSFYFDYSWYGHFEVNKEIFQKVENTFADWRTKINKV
jgi:hypothetical protein